MKQTSLNDLAYSIACWDAAKQAKLPNGFLDQAFQLEQVADELLEHQREWYLERAARLGGVRS